MKKSNARFLFPALLCVFVLFAGLQTGTAAPPVPSEAKACLSAASPTQGALWLRVDGCYNMMICPDDDYCWNQCPTASSAACINNVCQFSLPGGGGGSPGNGCPYESLCAEDYHCTFPGGITGTCVNSRCVC
jgi:hypothetical protein